MTEVTLTHGSVEAIGYEEIAWPIYIVVGDGPDREDYVPAYYRLEGPNGPITYMSPGVDEVIPTTMHNLVLDLIEFDGELCDVEETPYDRLESNW